jgi:hypothetical protein
MSLDWNRACWRVHVVDNCARTRTQLWLRRKEGTREPKDISRDHSDVSRIRSDKFSIGPEFLVGQEGRGQKLDRGRHLPTKARRLHRTVAQRCKIPKKQIIAENMDLSDSEAEKFWPVYDQYAAELSRIYDTKIALLNDYSENYSSMTGEQAENYIRKRAEVEQSIMQLRLKYVPAFRKVLSGRETALFYQLDWRLGLAIDVELVQVPLINQ